MLSEQLSLNDFLRSVLPLLEQHGFSAGTELSILRGGANNRVFRVADSNREAVLKHYFRNPGDPRDRFRTEKTFYDLLWNCGVRSIPPPLGWEEELRVGLFGFVQGRKLTPVEVTRERIQEAARFVVELNRRREQPSAKTVENASEACFSIKEHLAIVERRVARLQVVEVQSSLDAAAGEFVKEKLQPGFWQRLAPGHRRLRLLPEGNR